MYNILKRKVFLYLSVILEVGNIYLFFSNINKKDKIAGLEAQIQDLEGEIDMVEGERQEEGKTEEDVILLSGAHRSAGAEYYLPDLYCMIVLQKNNKFQCGMPRTKVAVYLFDYVTEEVEKLEVPEVYQEITDQGEAIEDVELEEIEVKEIGDEKNLYESRDRVVGRDALFTI